MIPEPPRPAERRLVHVLFVDLVGFTSLVEDLDAEDVALLQEHYFSQVAGLVAAAGGQVEKYIGDAVLATFGLPVLHPDDATAAVRAGLAVIESLAGLEARLGLPAGTLRVRVGVHTGEVVVTWAADGSWRLSGDVVNTAARLQTAAEPGTVVVGPDTALAVEGTLDLVALGELPLKGKAEGVGAWRVAGRRRGPVPDGGPFRGRAADLAALDAAHRGARGAERITVLAPPGVGRSRLVAEFAARAAGPAWLVRVRADEPGYAPVAGLLGAAGVAPEDLGERLARHGHTGPRAELSARHTADLLAGDEPAGAPAELWASWTAALDAHGEPGGPTPVWILDDVHLASADMLAFLDHAIAAPHRTPRLVVTTARPGEHPPSGAVHTLDPLTDDDVAALVADRVGAGTPGTAEGREPDGGPAQVAAALRESVAELDAELARAGELGPDAVLTIPFGAIPAPFGLCVFTMEAGVHADDLVAATGRDEPWGADVVRATSMVLPPVFPVLAGAGGEAPPPEGTVLALRGPTVDLRFALLDGTWQAAPGEDPTATITGTDDTAVLRFALGRAGADDPRVSFDGEAELAAGFKRWFPGP